MRSRLALAFTMAVGLLLVSTVPSGGAHEVTEVDGPEDRSALAARVTTTSAANFRDGLGLPSEPEHIETLRASYIAGTEVMLDFGSFLTPDEHVAVVERVRLEHDFSVLAERLESEMEFGGAWVEGDLDHTLFVITTTEEGLGESSLALIEQAGLHSLEIREVPLTWAELDEAKLTLRRNLDPASGIWALAIDPRSNSLVVSVDPTTSDDSVLQGIVDELPVPVLVEYLPVPVEESHTRTHLGDMRAGQRSVCTIGWAMTTIPNGGATRGTSAGHCYDNATNWNIGSSSYGTRLHVRGQTTENSEDIMSITLASGFARTDEVFGGALSLDTGGKVIPGNGTQACESQGYSNQNICGTVENNAEDLVLSGPDRDNTIRIDMCSRDGDSGAPTYTVPSFGTAHAAGMHILGTDNGDTCTTDDNTWSDRITELEAEIGLYLRTF